VTRVTLDSNVYLSALVFDRRPMQLLDMAANSEIDLAISDAIIGEIKSHLLDKFDWSPDRVEAALQDIRTLATHVSPIERMEVIKADPSDDRILECAVAAGSNVIISGDKHLLALGSFRGIEIMNVSDFLAQGRSR
jgi:putative PIN family toxin of toxin-antitoxin system